MKTVRTPDERFANLAGYDFEPHYVAIDDGDGGTLRMHYVDEGPRDATPVILLHGQPTWSYLYRKMIPPLLAAGYRCLAPDLVGFGRSDKPTEKSDYTVRRHVEWLERWLGSVDPSGAIYFGQDWGSLLGLTVVSRDPGRFERIMIANGTLPDPRNMDRFVDALMKGSSNPQAFTHWQDWIRERSSIDVGAIMVGEAKGLEWGAGMALDLTAEECSAYDAPFPDASYQAGALQFPLLAPSGPEHADTMQLFAEAWAVYDQWSKPFLTAYGKQDPVLGFADVLFQRHVPGAAGQPHRVFEDGTHFVQEQYGPELAQILIDWAGD